MNRWNLMDIYTSEIVGTYDTLLECVEIADFFMFTYQAVFHCYLAVAT